MLIQLALSGYTIQQNDIQNISFLLDDSVGDETTLSFTYQSAGMPNFNVEVYSPNGTKYVSTDSDITTVDNVAMIMKMKIPGTAEVKLIIGPYLLYLSLVVVVKISITKILLSVKTWKAWPA